MNKFTLLKSDLRRIENKYDKSISSYFSFFKFLVNVGVAMLLVYAYLLISHALFFDESLIDTCSGNLCFTLYYGFDRDNE
jgi:hypothetical protein|mmetsp:Transcript_20905/g.3382  ORF Transcript_20905/g.3382 Transcript_20905/m.3382 type:complete len:80 (+) Transcript_20905:652-891(+)